MSGKESIRSIQLSVRGKPTAFDLSADAGSIVVASPGCMTFFDIDGLGVPKHYIYYEQQNQIRRIRFQQDNMLAALRGGAVSIWDPSHSLRPLKSFIQDTDWITNLEWCSHTAQLISTCCDGGDGKIWDARSPYTPVQTLHVGGVCQKISWSKYNSNLLALSNATRVVIFDTRMLGSQNVVSSYEPPEGVLQFTWCAKDNQNMIIAARNGSLIWLGSISDKSEIASVPAAVDEASLLFATPIGRGAVVCRYEYMGGTQQSQPFLAPQGSRADTFRLCQDSNLKSKSINNPKIDAIVNLRPESKKVVVNLFGFPGYSKSSNKENDMLKVAQCPDPVVGVRWGHPGRLIPPMHNGQEMLFLSTSSCLHAVTVSASTMSRYGASTTTERPKLHTAVSSDVLLANSANKKSGRGDSDHAPLMKLEGPQYCLSGLKRYVTPADTVDQSVLPLTPPGAVHALPLTNRFGPDDVPGVGSNLSMSGEYWVQLQDSVLLLQKKLQAGYMEGLSIGLVDKYARQITLQLERPDSAPYAPSMSSSASSSKVIPPKLSSSTATISEKAVHSGNAFTDFATLSSFAEAGVQPEQQPIVEAPDQGELSATPKRAKKNNNTNPNGQVATGSGLTEKEKRLNDRAERIERGKAKNAALIISFPPSYPQTGYPTFTLRSGGLASSSSSLRSDIISELASIAKGKTLGTTINNRGEEIKEILTATKLLFDVAECFRCRTLQYWGVKVNIPQSKSLATLTMPNSEVISLIATGNGSVGKSLPNRQRGSGSFGDIGLDLDVVPEEVDRIGASCIDTELPSISEAFSSVLRKENSGEDISGESDRRRRIGGDDMYDGPDTDKVEKEVDPEGAIAFSKATEVIDPLAYSVPCPVSSGGFFAPSGAFMCFGGAKLSIMSCKEKNKSLSVNTELLNDPKRIIGVISTSEVKQNLGLGFSLNMYPKSYADMLLRQREREFYESEKITEDHQKLNQNSIIATTKSQRRNSGSAKSVRPIVKSSSGVFFVDRDADKLSSDTNSSDGNDQSDDDSSSYISSRQTESEETHSESDDSDVDENIKDKKFPQVTTSQKSQDLISSLNTNPLLYTAELDMDVLGAHIDQEQTILKRNISAGSSTSDLLGLFPGAGLTNQNITDAEARKKRFLVAEALQVSSQNPTLIEIFSHGFATPQALADEYDLGPCSCVELSIERTFHPVLTFEPRPDDVKGPAPKSPAALFAHLRAPYVGNSRFPRAVGSSRESVVYGTRKSIIPSSLSRSYQYSTTDLPDETRPRKSSSHNDLPYFAEVVNNDDVLSRSFDGDGRHGILQLDSTYAAEGLSQSYQSESFRTVTWGNDGETPKSDDAVPILSENERTLSEIEKSDTDARRRNSNSKSADKYKYIQQLPFNMADMDEYTDAYHVDDFSLSRNSGNPIKNARRPIHFDNNEEETLSSERQSSSSKRDKTVINPIIRDYIASKVMLRQDICRFNADLASRRGNIDAASLWHLLSISLNTMAISLPPQPIDENDVISSNENGRSRGLQTSWTANAIGLLLMKRVLNLCEQTGGVQTLASIICVLGGPSHVAVLLAGNHPYFSSCGPESMQVPVVFTPEMKDIRLRYNGVLLSYYNVLHHWRKFQLCVLVSKRIDFADSSLRESLLHVQSHISISSMASIESKELVSKDDNREVIDVARHKLAKVNSNLLSMCITCSTCSQSPLPSNWCGNCKAFAVCCGVCQEGIRGAAVYCPRCLHGGHVGHMKHWFGQMEEIYCPTGCGCECSAELKCADNELDDTSSDGDDTSSKMSFMGPSRQRTSSYSSYSTLGEQEDHDNDEDLNRSGQSLHQPVSVHQRLFQAR